MSDETRHAATERRMNHLHEQLVAVEAQRDGLLDDAYRYTNTIEAYQQQLAAERALYAEAKALLNDARAMLVADAVYDPGPWFEKHDAHRDRVAEHSDG